MPRGIQINEAVMAKLNGAPIDAEILFVVCMRFSSFDFPIEAFGCGRGGIRPRTFSKTGVSIVTMLP
jgi:hypothetical protein